MRIVLATIFSVIIPVLASVPPGPYKKNACPPVLLHLLVRSMHFNAHMLLIYTWTTYMSEINRYSSEAVPYGEKGQTFKSLVTGMVFNNDLALVCFILKGIISLQKGIK